MTTHGHVRHRTPTPTYRAWQNMRTRCNNPKSTQYRFYGGRGITVCERWSSFAAFLADVGDRPTSKHSLDRINSDGNYEPENVRWTTHVEQCRNRRSNVGVVRGDGTQFKSLAEAAESVGGTVCGIWDACNGNQLKHRGFEWRYS